MPKVSVVLTSYNCAHYLPQAIQSILDQTHVDLDLLISDDASNDGSKEIISSYCAKDERIRFFRQERNLGLIRNYNFLFAEAKGDYVAIQDADDWSAPSRIAKQVAVLADQRFILCGTGCLIHYPKGKDIGAELTASSIISGIEKEFPSLPASVMFRRDALNKFPGWPLFFEGGTSMDRYFLMDLLEGRLGYHIAEPLYHARVRPGSNHRTWNERKMITHHLYNRFAEERRSTGTDSLREADWQRIEKMETEIMADKRLRSESMRESAVINIDCGLLVSGAYMLACAIRANPLSCRNFRTGLYLLRSVMRRALCS